MEVGYHFRDYIYKRGQSYLKKDKVNILEDSDNLIRARVLGEEMYIVRIELRDGHTDSLYCSCPFAKRGSNCKHMAAVIELSIQTGNKHDFTVDALETYDDYGEDLKNGFDESFDHQEPLSQEMMSEIGHLLSILSHEDLVDYLIFLFESNPKLANTFVNFEFEMDGNTEDLS
ncbi:hypothetical protein G7062_03895 [Erysipelothrix sp. HDW6C]|uniref:SWIM zinc finger family protein n=1 Tax=Erysipelothrix sp. HDW6C TaxID=2714930 RepID=UPI00140BF70D|nr:SWIM zinc finger family protein [Erysipelothrix sp. HDW6C]QIK69487.1 hypothetical protein G7062_03895 [Erysipelothrix sp. HDW6C]